MPFGLDENGFTPKTTDDILASLNTQLKATFGEAFASELAESVAGQIVGVFAGELADLWNLALAVWRSRFPSLATGLSLDAVAEETGAIRLQSAPSTVDLTWSGTNGTMVPVGSIARVASTDARFITTVAGTVSGGTVTVAATSIEFGPILGPAGSISDIVTPISGITGVTNTLDAELGRDLETDAEFRARRALLLRQAGEATVGAIRSDLLALSGVDEVRIFNNPSGVTDADGLPAHSFEVVIRGGDDQEIVDEIFNSEPAGIQSVGTNSGTATDIEGATHTVQFSRPIDKNMYAEVVVTVNNNYPLDGDARIKQAIVDYWLSFSERIGKEVLTNAFYGPIYAVPGVESIDSLKIDDTTPAAVVAVTTVGAREIAVFDTSRVTVTST